jgi:DNA-binding NarL/FixJ family response regulator
MSRVLIVDDHQRVRRSVREALDRNLSGSVFGEAGGRAEALDLLSREEWDVVLLDLSLPDGTGIETLRQLRGLRPAMPVLVMSMHPEAQYGPAARAAGAAGYLVKGGDPAVLAAAVREVLQGAPATFAAGQGATAGQVLHDDLAQVLAALKINLQLARTAVDPAELQRRMAESVIMVDQAIEAMRRLSERLQSGRQGEEAP